MIYFRSSLKIYIIYKDFWECVIKALVKNVSSKVIEFQNEVYLRRRKNRIGIVIMLNYKPPL